MTTESLSAEILSYRHRSIPAPDPALDEVSFRDFPIAGDDPRSADPVIDAFEAGLAGISYYARTDGWNPPYGRSLDGAPQAVWLRRTLVEKLLAIDSQLRPLGLEVFLLDGYRTVAVQQAIRGRFLEIAREENPGASDEECEKAISGFIANSADFDPGNPKTWFSHITGAAVDLTLRVRASGELLHMGSVFDDPNEVSHTNYFERPGSPRGASAREARSNRRLLFWIMHRYDFANLPTEWWHFDYGDRLWVKDRKIVDPSVEDVVAWYAPVDPPAGFV